MDAGPGTGFRGAAGGSDLVPVIVSAAAAACSVAFFRVWVVFALDPAGNAGVGLPGVTLAREIGGYVPWAYVTPALLLVILLLSFLRLFGKSGLARNVFGPGLILVSFVLAVWPVRSILHISGRLRADLASPKMSLSVWWWVYCASLAVIIVIGVLELASSIWGPKRERY